jgi:hypothetical protein
MGVSGQRHAPATLYPRGKEPVHIAYEAGWASELVWTQRLEEKSFVSVIRPVTPLKRRSISVKLHGATSQKTVISTFLLLFLKINLLHFVK